MLCGISSRFQLLSPTERQVLHALLTRSPLSNPRRSYPVRLACVRHAASVRPEPGSNSCVQSLFASFRKRSLSFCRVFLPTRCLCLLASFALYSFQGACRCLIGDRCYSTKTHRYLQPQNTLIFEYILNYSYLHNNISLYLTVFNNSTKYLQISHFEKIEYDSVLSAYAHSRAA